MRWIKRSQWILAGVVAALAVFIAATAAWIDSRAGKAWLEATINEAADGTARVTGIGGTLPFHPIVEHVELADAGGPWGRLRALELDLAPLDLLRGRVTVQRLAAASIDIDRLPQTPQATPDSAEFTGSSRALPQLPVALDIRQLTIDSLQLPPDIFGEVIVWKVDAAGHLIGRDLRIDLQLAESGPSPLNFNLRLALANARIDALASIDDPRGLLLQRATGKALPLQVRLTEDTEASQNAGEWRGRLAALAGDNTRLDASLHLGATDNSSHLETQGRFKSGDLLPQILAPLVGDAVDFSLNVDEVSGERVTLRTLDVQAAGFQINGSGTYMPEDARIDTLLRLALPELAPLSDLAGQPIAGAATLDIAARGPLDLLQVAANLNASRAGAGPIAADNLQARVEAALAPGGGYDVQGRGRVTGIRLDNAALPAGLGEVVDWQFSGNSDAAAERLALTSLNIAGGGLGVSAEALLDRANDDVTATLRLRLEELRRFAELAVPGLKGQGEVNAALAGKLNGPISVRLDGEFKDLATGIPAADALLGGTLRLNAAAQRDASGRIEIEQAVLAAAAADVSARGVMDFPAGQMNTAVTASIDDLAVLSHAGLQTKGRLKLDAGLSGSPFAPVVDARLNGSGLTWQSVQFDRVTARLQAMIDDTPSASLTADLQKRDLALRLDGRAALSDNRKILNIPQLRLRSEDSVIEARLQTVLDTVVTSGQVTANIPDLKPFSALAGIAMDGRLNLKLALSTPRGRQDAELALAANDLSIAATDAEPITLRRLSVNGALSDLLRGPAGRLVASGEQLAVAGARLDTLRFIVQSREQNRFAMESTGAGDFRGRFSFSTSGNLALDRGTTRLTIARLDGKLADTSLALQQPVLVTMNGASLELSHLVLSVGDGRIEGAFKRDANRFDVNLTGRQLPVGLGAMLAGRPEISGALDLQLALAGPAAQPRGRLTLNARELRAGPERRSQPAIGFNAVAEIAPSEAIIEAAVEVGNTRLLSAEGTLPVTFGPAPGAVALAENRSVRFRARGEGDLATIADFLPLAGDRLAGAFRLALDGEGPIVQPQLTGELSLDRGRYENRASGLLIDALSLRVTADRDRVILRKLDANDGGNGRLEGSGTILLKSGQTPVTDATFFMAGFQALRRSDATLTASGSATINGPMDALALVAGVTVDEAEFFIPDPPPPSARKIPVTIINSATGRVIEQSQGPPDDSEGVLALDVAINVPGRTFIRGRGLDSEWEGDIRVRGNSAAPELTGALKVVRGKFAFFGKDLSLTRGTVSFAGGSKIEPDLDILAETTSAGTTFQVGASGTPDDLRIKLSSIPPLPEDEILSRMIFGREMTRLTPAQGLQLAQAAATLASGGPGMLDKMRRKLGLDTLDIGSGSDSDNLRPNARGDATGGSGGMENTGVSAGKYIGDGVYIGAEQRLSGETRSKVEIEILPNVSVETTAGTRGESIGVMWKKDY